MQTSEQFSILAYAFKASESFSIKRTLNSDDCQWELARVKPDSSYLLAHVNRFMVANNNVAVDHLNLDEAVIMQLKPKHPAAFLRTKLFAKKHSVFSTTGSVEFSFVYDNTVLAPLMIYVPLAKVGLITFGIQTATKQTDADTYLDLIHKLRVVENGKLQTICTSINMDVRAGEENNKIAGELNNTLVGTAMPRDGHYSWNMPTYFKYLMGNMEANTEMISPPRIQALSYVHTATRINDIVEIKKHLFRYSRVYNANYQPSNEVLNSSAHFMHPFESVHYAAFAEGATVLVNEDASGNTGFLDTYGDQVVKARLFWSWVLALIQRFALINAAHLTSQTYTTDPKPQVEVIAALVSRLYSIQIKCIFTEISHHTQQNEFYHLCLNSLRIVQLFEEIKSEITELNLFLEEDKRKADARQRELQLQLKEDAEKHSSQRDAGLNTTLGAIGIGISAAQISASLEPNQLILFFKWMLKGKYQLVKSWLVPYSFWHEAVIFCSNMLLGFLVGLVGRWVLIQFFRRKNTIKENR